MLGLENGPTPAEQKQMPPEFLEEMLELRMAIADLEPGESPERRRPSSLPRNVCGAVEMCPGAARILHRGGDTPGAPIAQLDRASVYGTEG